MNDMEFMTMLTNLHQAVEEICKGLEHILKIQENILIVLKELSKDA